jgi:hypothetical protein
MDVDTEHEHEHEFLKEYRREVNDQVFIIYVGELPTDRVFEICEDCGEERELPRKGVPANDE